MMKQYLIYEGGVQDLMGEPIDGSYNPYKFDIFVYIDLKSESFKMQIQRMGKTF